MKSLGRTSLRLLLLVMAGLCPPVVAACNALEPAQLDYRVLRGDTELGKGQVTLRTEGSDGCYVYRQTARPKFWLRWLTGDITEQSRFCLVDGQLRPLSYFFDRDGVGADKKNYQLDFDWEQGLVSGGKFESLPIKPGVSDQLMLQLKIRDWICKQVTAGKQPSSDPIETPFIKQKGADVYAFALTTQESIKVPAGRFETVRVDRVDPSNRKTSFWLAPDLDYQVVRAEQQKDDDPPLILEMTRSPRSLKGG